MRLRLFALAALALFSLAGCHSSDPQTSAPPVANAQGSTQEKAVWALVHRKYPRLDITAVHEVATDGSPLYVVEASTKTFATTAEVNFLVDGGTIIMGVGDQVRNLTQEMAEKNVQAAVARVYQRLPMNVAISHTYGKGERQVVMFADPDCPVCQAFEQEMDKHGAALNATVHVFSFPLQDAHPDALRKAAYLMCTADPGAAWHDWMVHAEGGWDAWAAQHPSQNNGDCQLNQRAALGAVLARQLGFSKTPTLLFPNGFILEGAPTVEGLEQIWARPAPVLPATAPASSSTAPARATP